VKPNTGLHPLPGPANELQKFVPRIDPSSHESLLVPSRGGETVEQLHERARTVMGRLIESLDDSDIDSSASATGEEERESVRAILVCSHAATIIALGRALTGDSALDVRTGCCSISRYRRRPGSQGTLGVWECEENGETSFLTRGEEAGSSSLWRVVV
jgi:transcription factor C subunit 7